MKKKNLPLSAAYGYIECGPVVLVSTAYKGKTNVMPMSWLTMMDFEPPLIGFVLSNRNVSFNNLTKTKECVINIPSAELLKKVVACGNSHGDKIDKFATFGLTAMPGEKVKAPLIDECFVNLECKVKDTKLVNQYNFFIVEVVKGWVSTAKKSYQTVHHYGKGTFMIAGKTVKTASKMK